MPAKPKMKRRLPDWVPMVVLVLALAVGTFGLGLVVARP
jgi:hypothetical protein